VKDEKCFRLSQLGPLQVRFLVPEGDPSKPRAGDCVHGQLLNDLRRGFEARILRVSPTVDAASGSYEVTAQLVGAGLDKFRPGMAVKILWRETPAAARPD
jgi:multidrug efflux pump subunit AcrA (membrane-fusion protein)